MNQEYNAYKLKLRQALPLDEKIKLTKNRIKQWYEHNDGNVYIAFSGGKDSTVLADLVWTEYPNVKAVFSNTGLEYPEIVDFVKSFGDKVITIRPKTPFNKVIEKYGYPIVSKEQSQYIYDVKLGGLSYEQILEIKKQHKYSSEKETENIAKKYNTNKSSIIRIIGNKYNRGKISNKYLYLLSAPFNISDKCCYHLKKSPFKRFEKETGLKPFLGEMASDSDLRKKNFLKQGCNAFNVGRPVSRPLGFWCENDIWDYLRTFNVPYSKIYDMGYKRTGCMFCGYGVHLENPNKFQIMKETHPKLYKYCMENLGLKEVFDFMGVKF